MTTTARFIRGVLPNGVAVVAELSQPVRNAGQPEWVCFIHCPALFEEDCKIAGAASEQALALASMFVEQMFEHHGIAKSDFGEE